MVLVLAFCKVARQPGNESKLVYVIRVQSVERQIYAKGRDPRAASWTVAKRWADARRFARDRLLLVQAAPAADCSKECLKHHACRV